MSCGPSTKNGGGLSSWSTLKYCFKFYPTTNKRHFRKETQYSFFIFVFRFEKRSDSWCIDQSIVYILSIIIIIIIKDIKIIELIDCFELLFDFE